MRVGSRVSSRPGCSLKSQARKVTCRYGDKQAPVKVK